MAFILGRDWLNKNAVMLFLDLGSQWDIPKDNSGRPLSKVEYVNCQEGESDNDDNDVENFINNESNLVKPNSDVKSNAVSVSSDKDSLKINESIDEECDISSSEDDIPLFDLQKRFRGQVKIDITSDNIDSERIIWNHSCALALNLFNIVYHFFILSTLLPGT